MIWRLPSRGLAVLLALAVSGTGCMAVPMVAGQIRFPPSAEVIFEGRGDALAAFRNSVGRAGGVITVDTREFVRGEFSGGALRLEARLLAGGEAQRLTLSTSSDRGRKLSWLGSDGDRQASARVAAIMEDAGFRPVPVRPPAL